MNLAPFQSTTNVPNRHSPIMEFNPIPNRMILNSNPELHKMHQQQQLHQQQPPQLQQNSNPELHKMHQQQQLHQQQPPQLQQQAEIEVEKWRNWLPSGHSFKTTEEEVLIRSLYTNLVNCKWKELLPTGYRFKPTDEELLRYLYSKLRNLPIRHGVIADVNVYEHHPHSLSDMAHDAGDEVLYFFTALKRKHLNGMRPNRGTTTGGGYWRTTSKPIDITVSHSVHSNNSEAGVIKIMGIKRSLVYMIGKPSDKGTKTNWIMHEYTIHDVVPSPSQQPIQWNKYIVCSIYHRQTRAGDSDELSVSGKRKQHEQQRIETNTETETEAEEFDNEVHKQKQDFVEDDYVLNPTKRIKAN